MAEIRKKDSISTVAVVQPSRDEKNPKSSGSTSMVARGVIDSLASQTSQVPRSLITLSGPSGEEWDVHGCLELRPQSPTALSKSKKKRKKKKKTLSSSSSTSVRQGSPSHPVASDRPTIFAIGIRDGQLSGEVTLPSLEEEALLKEAIESWQVGGRITLIDLLGLMIDHGYSEIIEIAAQIKHFASASLLETVQELKTSFEGYYCLVFISLFAESFSLQNPEMEKYLDNKFLLTREKASEVFLSRVRDSLDKVQADLDGMVSGLKAKFSRNARVLAIKLRPLAEIDKQIADIQKSIDLFVSLLGNDQALAFLIDSNIFGLCGPEIVEVRNAERGFEHLQKLAHFQNNLIQSAKERRLVCIGLPVFDEFVKLFPKKLSKESLFELSRNCVEVTVVLGEMEAVCVDNVRRALSGRLTFDEYCRENHVVPSREKTHEQFISDIWAKSLLVSLVSSFAQDIHAIVDESLMPLVCDEYLEKRTSYNRMALNFKWFIDSNLASSSRAVDIERFPILSSSRAFGSFPEELQKDFDKIETEFALSFLPIVPSILYCVKKMSETGFFSLNIWANMADRFSPLVKDCFPVMLTQFSAMKSKYTDRCQTKIDELSPEKRLPAVEELRELFLESSLTVCRNVLFCADLRALMDMYKFEDLVSESYLLPRELCDLLELRELEERVQAGLVELVSESSSSGSSEEEEVSGEELEVISRVEEIASSVTKKASLPPTYVKRSVPIAKRASPAKVKKKSRSRTRPISIPPGTKIRDILKAIKEKLGLTPDRTDGSHMVFEEGGSIAVLSFHGGGGTLPRGTARSLEDQLQTLYEKQQVSKKV